MAQKAVVRDPSDDPTNSYEFPSTRKIQFCHPGYKTDSNVLLQLSAYDGQGIHYQTAHTACAIVANNRWDGYLSVDIQGQHRVEPESPDDCLQGQIYYFHVPNNPVYPIVPTFAHWPFPHGNLPSSWADLPTAAGKLPLCSERCSLTRSIFPLKTAHVVPENPSSLKWFRTNSMSLYGQYHSLGNTLRLRDDVHHIFNRQPQFAILPKGDSMVAHFFNAPDATIEAVQRYHNVPLQHFENVRVEYLLARLAWTVFPYLGTFLSVAKQRNLIVCDDGGVQTEATLGGEECHQIYAQSLTLRKWQSDKGAKDIPEDDDPWDDHLAASDSGPDGELGRLSDLRSRKRKRDISSASKGERVQSNSHDMKQHHHKVFAKKDRGVVSDHKDMVPVSEIVEQSEGFTGEDGYVLINSSNSTSKLEIIAQCEAYREEGDDDVFDHTKVILQKGKDYFAATIKQPVPKNVVLDPTSLDLTPIPSEHFCPRVKDGITQLFKPLPDAYVKRPNLLSWEPSDTNPESIAELVMQEAEICEILKKHPHPNIAQYLGCLVEDGRITGLCFVKYGATIFEALKHSNAAERNLYIEDITRGVHHLHQLGLIHNDLNPTNIMMDDKIPVIIDFDSCRPVGERLGNKVGTFPWELEDAELATPDNDFHSLEKIREFITTASKGENLV